MKSKFNYAYQQEFPYRANHILECEFYLLENMDCCLVVYQPYRPLVQFVQGIDKNNYVLIIFDYTLILELGYTFYYKIMDKRNKFFHSPGK